MISVIRYSSNQKAEWDQFVQTSDSPIFMFERNYMDYHKARFEDCSLMLYDKAKLVALFPGHVSKESFCSHLGLTFGGLIVKQNVNYQLIENIYGVINKFLSARGIKKLLVKLKPAFYSGSMDSSELFFFQSNVEKSLDLKLSTLISTKNHLFPKSTIEKRKLKLDQFELCFSDDFSSFWEILEDNLKTFHNTKPVHSIDEMVSLKKAFPDGIKLFVVKNKQTEHIDAGAVLYKFNKVMKLQYLAASAEGRQNRASHALYYGFISEYLDKVDYIDLGNCMDNPNRINYDLLYIKQRFGASVYSMLSYEYSTSVMF